ncbi:MAG: undecaprenyldiphospho-muramoylpentapeptide beta-N-acetylglucosaminyltransferase [Kangiellaceae bacterium]|jgi:UDP-N-acetylglucosamine--N-acetylmuramyl-(pentapeptide) pyrophosphoryl-undecaprenol N-acetylglucosamine transferase|nr:undecaprenyldiphospho-muramoylpentapeptide beta-N-acetylglucosaminyltransferase [Kangiellaceae bacterium]
MAKTIMMMAGGTGGHIYPALAVAKELQRKGYNILWLGSEGGMEQELVPREGIELEKLPISGLRGKGAVSLLVAPFKLLQSILLSINILRKYKVDLSAGFGGFASGPGGIATVLTMRPLLIHEQNAVAGMTNKVLAKFANTVCQAFDGAFLKNNKLFTTGNPIRQELLQVAGQKHYDLVRLKSNLNVLIIGGSRGARSLNQQLPGQLKELVKSRKISVVHQTGLGNQDAVLKSYQHIENVEVFDYLHDIDTYYKWADLIICRAGALTVSEVAALGLPAIFIPYPYAVDDHQTQNAKTLVKVGAAMMIEDKAIDQVRGILEGLISHPEKIVDMSKSSQKVAIDNATNIIADNCIKLVEKASS